jgi:flagella basal body P-ring formation protein FlgA
VVRVEVASGAARLTLNGRSESAGRVGETVRVRNLEANRTFTARVAGKGAVAVEAGK